jgi:hypothetical protein
MGGSNLEGSGIIAMMSDAPCTACTSTTASHKCCSRALNEAPWSPERQDAQDSDSGGAQDSSGAHTARGRPMGASARCVQGRVLCLSIQGLNAPAAPRLALTQLDAALLGAFFVRRLCSWGLQHMTPKLRTHGADRKLEA